jgi:hypothetical protein
MRLVAYVIGGWFLVSLLGSSMFAYGSLGAASLLGPVVVLGAVVWLVHGYRSGARTAVASDARSARLAVLESRLASLEEALPADPLDNEQVVAAWNLHDDGANAPLAATYADVRAQLASAQQDALVARSTGDAAAFARAERAADEVGEYVRAFRLLATEAPELLDRAIAAHADAQRAVDRRRADTEDATDLEVLVEADAKLQRAREALARGHERPLDALVLASAARKLVDAN